MTCSSKMNFFKTRQVSLVFHSEYFLWFSLWIFLFLCLISVMQRKSLIYALVFGVFFFFFFLWWIFLLVFFFFFCGGRIWSFFLIMWLEKRILKNHRGFSLQKLRKEVKVKRMGLIFDNVIKLTYDLRINFLDSMDTWKLLIKQCSSSCLCLHKHSTVKFIFLYMVFFFKCKSESAKSCLTYVHIYSKEKAICLACLEFF